MKLLKVTVLNIFFISAFLFSGAVYAANYDWTQNYGTVKRLYPSSGGKTFFQLQGGYTAMNPVNGYYYVPTIHDNYQAMIGLLYKAAELRWTIYARTATQLDSNGHATVLYFVVDY